MKEFALKRHEPEEWFEESLPMKQFHSVEFAIDGLSCLHQFRIWNIMPASMCVLVRENSEILRCLKVGDILQLKYYTSDEFCPVTYLRTQIRHITKEEEGRFRGHYLVGLTIVKDAYQASNN